MANLKHRDELLSELVEKLRKFDTYRLADIKVSLLDENKKVLVSYYGLQPALYVLVEDLYWDENGEYTSARYVELNIA